jgi:hypothetical protein
MIAKRASMQKKTHLIATIGILFVGTGWIIDTKSNGAPVASTNAPGELTCNRSPCHTGSPLNSGPGNLSLVIAGAEEGYLPGETYDVTVTMAQAGIERFGFQTLALHDQDTTNAGTWTITDELRTRISSGILQYEGRKYLTYRYAGTTPVAPGHGQWSFQWTAPESNTGPITFYSAAVAANNDGTDQGDLAYTLQHTLAPSVFASVEESQPSRSHVRLFPNPTANDLRIHYTTEILGTTTIHLTDPLSRKSELLMQNMDTPGEHEVRISLKGRYAAGTYLVTITNNGTTSSHKLIIQ